MRKKMPLISNLEPTLVMLCLLHWKSPNVARQFILAVVIVKSYSLLCAMALKVATNNLVSPLLIHTNPQRGRYCSFQTEIFFLTRLKEGPTYLMSRLNLGWLAKVLCYIKSG
jgi:hypothetical protein